MCGFNQKMLGGLAAFQEGLVEHGLINRAKIKNQSVKKTLEDEIRDTERRQQLLEMLKS